MRERGSLDQGDCVGDGKHWVESRDRGRYRNGQDLVAGGVEGEQEYAQGDVQVLSLHD